MEKRETTLIAQDTLQFEELVTTQHSATVSDTRLKDDGFAMTDIEKIHTIAGHFREIMSTLGLDLTEDSLKGTPDRVARMYVKEIFSGLSPLNKPEISLSDNRYQYKQMLVEKNIALCSCCEHHFLPIMGKVHVAYISSGNVITSSNLQQIIQYYARRPQVQGRLTIQIADKLKSVLNTEDVAVVIDAVNLCASLRGFNDRNNTTFTTEYGGAFLSAERKREFLSYIA